MTQSTALTVSLCVVSAFVGALIALVTAFYVPGPVPFGVVATVLLIGPYAHLVGRVMRSAAVATIPALAWLTTTMVLAGSRREGDLLVAATTAGIAFLLLGTVSAAVGIGTVRAGVERDDRRAAAREVQRAAAEAEAAETPTH